MNEHIKQLAIEAKIHMVSEPRLQQFALLMIEDCIQTLINYGYNDAADCLYDIHFGRDTSV